MREPFVNRVVLIVVLWAVCFSLGTSANAERKKNDTQAAFELSYDEVLALHKELRGLAGKFMPQDAYEKFAKEQLFLWDERLEKGLLGRIDTYKMLFEIVGARRARYGKRPN